MRGIPRKAAPASETFPMSVALDSSSEAEEKADVAQIADRVYGGDSGLRWIAGCGCGI